MDSVDTLPDLFESQAAKTPGSPAVVHESGRVTYRQLNVRSDALARWLVDNGVGPGHVVAVAVLRTPELIATLLAVLKSGAAYLPLDLRHMDGRAVAVLADAGATTLIFSSRQPEARQLAEKFSGLSMAIEEATRPPSQDADKSTTAIGKRPGPDDLAYVIYTSGSTGRPKGVAVEHRSIAHLAVEMGRLLGSERIAHVLASTSIGFDVSAFEIFCPLVGGGAVHLIHDALEIADQPPQVQQATLISAVPSVVAQLLEAGALPAGPKTLVLAGEELVPKLAQRIRATHPDYTIVNAYGPTEATVYATVSPLDAESDSAPPIGRPLRGVTAHVLDEQLRAVPTGSTGELYLGGVGLARGYLNQPELTAARFINDPHDPSNGRMYRTGDLVRWTADGLLAYVGRIDEQVKIRGIRVEPGEVEAVLTRHPAVAQAAVVAAQARPGEKALAAFLTVTRGCTLRVAELREFASATLPDYMVPTIFNVLDSFPLTEHGKLDRGALVAAQIQTTATEVDQRQAPTDAQERVRALFAELLGTTPSETEDDFFTLGGHSLLAIRLIGRIRREFGVAIPIRDFRLEPSIAGVVRLLAQAG